MPPSARKSSLGARNGPKKYVPYRADDFQHGKKTGMAVDYVEHTDEFEPFEKVLDQADARTPFRIHNPRKRRVTKTPVVQQEVIDDDSDYGERSMDLDESTPRGPSAYFAHTRMNSFNSSVPRVGSSSRPVNHSSDVNYDDVPSPRASPSFMAAKRSQSNMKNSRTSIPSRLSQSVVADSEEDPQGSEEDPPGSEEGPEVAAPDYGDDGGMASMELEDDYPPQPSPPLRTPHAARYQFQGQETPRRKSFGNLAREPSELEDEPRDVDMDDDDRPLSAKARGKQREAPYGTRISRGLQEAELEPIPEEDETPPPASPPKKKGGKGKASKEKTTKEKTTKERASKKNRKENEVPRSTTRELMRDASPDDADATGLRRSKRRHYAPLAWWRLEKVVYGRRENGPCYVANIKEIHREPVPEPQPLGAKRRKIIRKKSQTVEAEPQQFLVYDPEEGWDDETDPHCTVLEYGKEGKEVKRRVAFTDKMTSPKAAAQGSFFFQKVFSDCDHLAAGQLIIPPGSTKPTKSTKDNTFVFYVIQGAVKFCVHQTNFILATGGMFLVPRGNIYYIQNICDRDAKLFFAQARRMTEEAADDEEVESESGSRDRSKSAPEDAHASDEEAEPSTEPKKRKRIANS
ncbi:Mif2/CENP-C like-domain-containing protein [Epithele typhae]|uniref:Mif2/CENP-C like-domain-containing protein n=1 Tax=Epithele typhae TaxID=378194 RepID=UPI00200765BC|nr:Mif2/CENP-C like-domain-containing protein [Epithele typhae]KAH9931701.1 Mif2/CENP-C like-domain-containing protein [Epithele typhae]